MISNLVTWWKERAAIRAWRQSTLGQTLSAHTQEYFTKYPRLADFSQETKDKIVGDFYRSVFGLAQAPNPFLAMRERLASYVVGFAGYQVWCLTEDEKRSDALYSDCPYISGTLYRHIDKAVEHVEEFRELKWKYPNISKEELVSFCNSRCLLHLYYVNGFNYVRSDFDDFDQAKDWLRPFLRSMLIWEEDRMREKLGMERLLPDSLDGLKHSTFMNLVVNGHRNPYFEWDKSWGEENAQQGAPADVLAPRARG